MANQAMLDRAFAACSHPIRRGIVERLLDGEMTVGEATGEFDVSKPAISRHLRVLEDAGAIARVKEGRTHRLRLSERPFEDASDWLSELRAMWERKFDVVERYLAEQRAAGASSGRAAGAGSRSAAAGATPGASGLAAETTRSGTPRRGQRVGETR